MGSNRLCHLHFPPVPRHQCVIVVHNGFHHRAVHSDLPPDESPDSLHGQPGQKDHHGTVDLRLCLLQSVADSHQDQTSALQRSGGQGDLHVRPVEEELPGVLLRRFHSVLHFPAAAVLRSVRADRQGPLHQGHTEELEWEVEWPGLTARE